MSHLKYTLYFSALLATWFTPISAFAGSDWETTNLWSNETTSTSQPQVPSNDWGNTTSTYQAQPQQQSSTSTGADSCIIQTSIKNNGFDLRTGISVPIGYNNAYRTISATLDLSLGYRWKYGGIYVDQNLGYVQYRGNDGLISYVDQKQGFMWTYNKEGYYKTGVQTGSPLNKDDNGLIGYTMLTGRAFIPATSSLNIPIHLGVGSIYGSYEVIPIPTQDATPVRFGIGLKVGVGVEYKFKSNVFLGFNFDYAINIITSNNQHLYIHYFIPGITIGFTG